MAKMERGAVDAILEEARPAILMNAFCEFVYEGRIDSKLAAKLLKTSEEEFVSYFAKWVPAACKTQEQGNATQ